jgi:hypothetical protein
MKFVSLFVCLVWLGASLAGCRPGVSRTVDEARLAQSPRRILWAWERPEDLRFLDSKVFGVAYLAQTLVLTGDEVVFKPRRQPLELPEGVFLIAVTRIETLKETAKRPALSDAQRGEIVRLVVKSAAATGVRAVQTDFDVVVSERPFYQALAADIRREIPAQTGFSMTALASWCVGDRWLGSMPVDEAVPMAFEMGADADRIRDFLANGNDWTEPLCRGSYGVSVDDPLRTPKFQPNRHFWYFKSSAWKANDVSRLVQ